MLLELRVVTRNGVALYAVATDLFPPLHATTTTEDHLDSKACALALGLVELMKSKGTYKSFDRFLVDMAKLEQKELEEKERKEKGG